MMKIQSYMSIIIVVSLSLLVLAGCWNPLSATGESETMITMPPTEPETTIDITTYFKVYEPVEITDDKTIYLEQIAVLSEYKEELFLLRETYPEFADIINSEINQVNLLLNNYHGQVRLIEEEEAKWSARMEEYPEATTIWLFMKNELGWNDYVCAGVLGNMLAECSHGGSLALNPYAYNSKENAYGICQWRNVNAHDRDLEGQLEYLADTVEKEFNTYGKLCYKKGFKYEDFIAMEDEQEAAVAFAKIYERCAKYAINCRKGYATKVLEYFTS